MNLDCSRSNSQSAVRYWIEICFWWGWNTSEFCSPQSNTWIATTKCSVTAHTVVGRWSTYCYGISSISYAVLEAVSTIYPPWWRAGGTGADWFASHHQWNLTWTERRWCSFGSPRTAPKSGSSCLIYNKITNYLRIAVEHYYWRLDQCSVVDIGLIHKYDTKTHSLVRLARCSQELKMTSLIQ